MTPESILDLAIKKPTRAERAAYLDEVCGADLKLRLEIEALIQAHEARGDFMSKPAAEHTAAFNPTNTTGFTQQAIDQIGPYKLREKLGEGGMGTVYVADQKEPVQRRVAIKLIKPGSDSKSLLARFEQERQALALMDHPNIAKVFDAGVFERTPYFVMELIKGVPITKYCDDARLSPRQRLDLFLPVCQAVQHAHQKGIIHRDLKPSNILIGIYDGKPIPKVIDFGVAKATGSRLTDQSIYTEVGSLVGTLEYMSPEQAELNNLDIDTRSDIYALGVILYELLTGSVPFSRNELEKVGLGEMLRVIKEVEPSKPSTKLSGSGTLPSIAANRHMEPTKLSQMVKGELDWIVMKCLEKDRSRRYETANQLGMEISRYLADEPVLAGPPSAAYRFRKFAVRNRGKMLACGVILGTLIAGIVGTTWGMITAEQARLSEAEQRNQAEQANRQAFTALESFTDSLMEKQIASRTVLTANEKAILLNAVKQWEVFAQSKGDSSQSRMIRIKGTLRVANLQEFLGLHDEAEGNYRKAIALGESRINEPVSITDFESDLANCHNNLGLLLKATARPKEAETHFRRSIELGDRLVAREPKLPVHRYKLAGSLCNLGNLIRWQGKTVDAETLYTRSLVILNDLIAQYPDEPTYRHRKAIVLQSSATIDSHAMKQFDSALEIMINLTREHPTEPDYQSTLAGIHGDYGDLLGSIGKHVEAERQYRHGSAVHRKLSIEFPSAPHYRRYLAISYSHLATLLDNQGKRAEALDLYRQSLDIQQRLAKDYPTVTQHRSTLADTHNDIALHLGSINQGREAERHFRDAISLREQLIKETPSSAQERLSLSHHYQGLAMLLSYRKDLANAETLYRQALSIRQELVMQFPDNIEFNVELGASCCNFATFLNGAQRTAESLLLFDQAISLLTVSYDANHQFKNAQNYLFNTLVARARAYFILEKYPQALGDLERAMPLADSPDRTDIRFMRADVRVRVGLVTEGISDLSALISELDSRSISHRWTGGQLFECASVYAVASGKATTQKQDYADRAMILLKRAVDAGFKNASNITKNKDLDSVRDRNDFKKLLTELTRQSTQSNQSQSTKP